MFWQSWITEHWFELLQIIALPGGLLYTGFAIHADAKAKRVANLLTITQQHRDIWMLLFTHPELTRVLHKNLNLKVNPVTDKEERFLRFLILHLNASYQAIKSGVFDEPLGLKKDITTFFALPIPLMAWKGIREYCDQDFVQFVDGLQNAEGL